MKLNSTLFLDSERRENKNQKMNVNNSLIVNCWFKLKHLFYQFPWTQKNVLVNHHANRLKL